MREANQPGYPVDLRSLAIRASAAAGPFGDFEGRAARVVARATGLLTIIQDDNSVPQTPDLRIEDRGEIVGLCEIVTTTVGLRAEQLRAFSQGRLEFESESLTATWWVTVLPRARRAGLEGKLVDASSRLEASGAHQQVNTLSSLRDKPAEILELERVGLTDVICNPTPREGPGKIYGLPEGIGGPVETDWTECSRWIDGLLHGQLCQRKLAKLIRAGGAPSRHLYVGVTGNDPWPVHQALKTDVVEVPMSPPTLPEGLTHLWLHGAEFPGRVLAWWPERGWFDVRTRWATP